MFEATHQSRLQPSKDQTICPFSLPIRLRVRNRRLVNPSALRSAESSEFFRVKVRTIVRYDAVRDAISEYQPSNETDSHTRIQTLDGLGLNPFGKLVDCHKQMCETTSASP